MKMKARDFDKKLNENEIILYIAASMEVLPHSTLTL